MKFVVIDATERKVEVVNVADLYQAYPLAGLEPGKVDFGTLLHNEDGSGLSITVYEYGLFVPPDEGHYFSIGPQLFEGGAVIFAFDQEGETEDCDQPPPVMFYRSAKEVEKAIRRGEIHRPETRINGELVWSWPPKPDGKDNP